MDIETPKRRYHTPILIVYGTFEELTRSPLCIDFPGVPVRDINGNPTGYCYGSFS